jgi:hypothetical protein
MKQIIIFSALILYEWPLSEMNHKHGYLDHRIFRENINIQSNAKTST